MVTFSLDESKKKTATPPSSQWKQYKKSTDQVPLLPMNTLLYDVPESDRRNQNCIEIPTQYKSTIPLQHYSIANLIKYS